MMEDSPTSARARAAFESPAPPLGNFVVPRRYARIPLESPLRAQIGGQQMSMARVKTISLGGAYLESSQRLSVGDSIQLEVRAWPAQDSFHRRRAQPWPGWQRRGIRAHERRRSRPPTPTGPQAPLAGVCTAGSSYSQSLHSECTQNKTGFSMRHLASKASQNA